MPHIGLGAERIKANVTIDTSVLIFPDEAIEFGQEWIIVKQTDEADGATTGVFYHIRKRRPEDPAALMIDSILEGK